MASLPGSVVARLRNQFAALCVALVAVCLDVTGWIEPIESRVRDALVRQLYSPVQWVRTIESMAGRGVSRIIEAGPGKVLAGLCKRIDKSLLAMPVYDPDTLAKAVTAS